MKIYFLGIFLKSGFDGGDFQTEGTVSTKAPSWKRLLHVLGTVQMRKSGEECGP